MSKLISRNRHIQSGAMCIDGTRIRTRAIWYFWRAGDDPIQIIANYPTITIAQIEAAVAYEQSWWRRLQRRMADWLIDDDDRLRGTSGLVQRIGMRQ